MTKNYRFEEIRLYAIFSFIFMSLLYFGIATAFIPYNEINQGPSRTFFLTFMASSIYNLIRYHYFNTTKYNSDRLFLIYGCMDLFYVSYYFGIPALDQGGKVVIMFILIISCIYRGRRIGILLTLLWFPVKMFSDSFFMYFIRKPGNHEIHNMMGYQNIMDALYFEVMLLILVFITHVIYTEISDKERENERLLNELEEHYKELAEAHEKDEEHNNKLKRANADLEELNNKLAYRIGEFFTLQQISQAIGSILDMDELMKFVNDITLGVMGVKDSTIISFDETRSKLEILDTNITVKSDYNILNENINCKVLLDILESGSSVCDNDVDVNKYAFAKRRNVKSLICVPVIAKTKRFGLILIEQDFTNAFNEDKLRLLTIIGQQVGMAMENADLYKKMHELAIRDNLTGAYNRMYFYQRFEEEFANIQRNGGEAAVVMLDIDHFKRFNDTYGHPFGDKVLKSMVDIIKGVLRNKDILARIGGEEFVILLPNTSSSQAYDMIEKLRVDVENTNVSDKSVCSSVTASFGIASFSRNPSSIAEILKNADDALYEAKKSGRNCVKIAAH